MSKGHVVFEDMCRYLRSHRLSHVEVGEIANLCVNFGRIDGLICCTFRTSHIKSGAIIEEKIFTLKHDLDLVRIK